MTSGTVATRRRRHTFQSVRWRRIVLGGGLAVLLLLLWQWYSSRSAHNIFIASSPSRSWDSLVALVTTGSFWSVQLAATAQGLALGWSCAVAAGLLLGAALGYVRTLREALEPLLFSINFVPRLALIPLLTLWLGYGLTYKAVVVVIAGFFPVLLNTMDGVRRADNELMRMSRSFGAGPVWQLFTVALPGSLPSVFAGLRQSLAHSVVGVIGAEIWASSAGLGWLIANAELQVRTDRIIATIIVVTVVGVLLNETLRLVESRCTRWYPRERR